MKNVLWLCGLLGGLASSSLGFGQSAEPPASIPSNGSLQLVVEAPSQNSDDPNVGGFNFAQTPVLNAQNCNDPNDTAVTIAWTIVTPSAVAPGSQLQVYLRPDTDCAAQETSPSSLIADQALNGSLTGVIGSPGDGTDLGFGRVLQADNACAYGGISQTTYAICFEINQAGAPGFSNLFNYVPFTVATATPIAPTLTGLTAANGDISVAVALGDDATNISSFNYYWCDYGSNQAAVLSDPTNPCNQGGPAGPRLDLSVYRGVTNQLSSDGNAGAYQITGLSNDTTYAVTVQAVDDVGNLGIFSPLETAEPTKDTTGPSGASSTPSFRSGGGCSSAGKSEKSPLVILGLFVWFVLRRRHQLKSR